MSDSPLKAEVFDRLRQATTKDPDVLYELCREYVSEARKTLAELRAALRGQDALQLRERAHYLKGSSLMIGAKDLSQSCAVLEKMGRDNDFSAAESALQQAEAALLAVEAELIRQLGTAVIPAEGSAA